MTTQQTLWSWVPLTSPCDLLLPGPRYALNGYAGVAVHSRPVPVPVQVLYNTVMEKPSPKNNRKFLLHRSVFDLVDDHGYLSLTDQKLLGWYLGLTPEDRNIILDEGGFHQFLQSHPALQLSTHHVHVKSGGGRTVPAQPAITCNHNMWEEPGAENREPGEVTCHSQRRSASQMAGAAAACGDPVIRASFSLDIELDPSAQRRSPELERRSPPVQDQAANATANRAEVRPVHSVKDESELCGSDGANFTSDAQEDDFHSIMEEDVSILALGPPETPTPPAEQHRVPTRDVMVGTEFAPCASAFTQTEEPRTADKHVMTEVHMADLDYLSEEFIKLVAAQTEQQEKKKRWSCSVRSACGCVERAQRAELRLLAVQHRMCRQHCWRLYCASAEGEQDPYWPKEPPANISGVLRELERDYHRLRDRILEGVPLEQLQPLSVHSEKVVGGAGYVPAHMIGDVLEGPSSRSVPEPQGPKEEETGLQEDRRTGRAATCVPRGGGEADKPEETQTIRAGAAGESWFDAEEDLEAGGAAAAAAPDATDEPPGDPVLCVANLPRDVTQSEVKPKYRPCEVSDLKNDPRVAMATVTGPNSAREPNGFRALHVEHIHRAAAGERRSRSQSQASGRVGESSQEVAKLPPEPEPAPGNPERQPSSSTDSRRPVCVSPTAKATFLPQHYGTMGSLDSLMAELTVHHPDVGRRRILDALAELRAEHQGALSGLPLRRIREMTSELLTGTEKVRPLV